MIQTFRYLEDTQAHTLSLPTRLLSGREHTCTSLIHFPQPTCQFVWPRRLLMVSATFVYGDTGYSDYRSLKKQIRCIKLEQGGILEPVMEISHDFNQDSGTESTELDKSFGKPGETNYHDFRLLDVS
ncbi:hypothetical protein ID866_2091 [Astraeus odoratus]|nr:hypothetical protein ID866_2091 [Astraeus odoratus]